MGSYKVLLARRHIIRAVRAAEGITVKELALRIGWPEFQVRHTLQGQKIHRSIAEAVATYFGVPASVLFFEVDLENPPDEAKKSTVRSCKCAKKATAA